MNDIIICTEYLTALFSDLCLQRNIYLLDYASMYKDRSLFYKKFVRI